MGIEPTTFSLRVRCSTIEPHQHINDEHITYQLTTDLMAIDLLSTYYPITAALSSKMWAAVTVIE